MPRRELHGRRSTFPPLLAPGPRGLPRRPPLSISPATAPPPRIETALIPACAHSRAAAPKVGHQRQIVLMPPRMLVSIIPRVASRRKEGHQNSLLVKMSFAEPASYHRVDRCESACVCACVRVHWRRAATHAMINDLVRPKNAAASLFTIRGRTNEPNPAVKPPYHLSILPVIRETPE